jgi:alanyl-tRNA synthetase
MKLSDLVDGIKGTELLYLGDSYAKTCQAKVLRAEFDGKKNVYLILDKTIFHPKGGGQPTDKGVIHNQKFYVQVKKAMYVKGVVVHYGRLNGEISKGNVVGELDWKRRHLFMRRHTVGHLFDHCLTMVSGKPVETTESWLESPCYLGYKGELPATQHLERAEKLANSMISNGAIVNIEYITYTELIAKAPQAPNIYRLPVLERYRIVTIEGCSPIPCAGTHLKNIDEIGHFTVEKYVKNVDSFRIYYDVQ